MPLSIQWDLQWVYTFFVHVIPVGLEPMTLAVWLNVHLCAWLCVFVCVCVCARRLQQSSATVACATVLLSYEGLSSSSDTTVHHHVASFVLSSWCPSDNSFTTSTVSLYVYVSLCAVPYMCAPICVCVCASIWWGCWREGAEWDHLPCNDTEWGNPTQPHRLNC